MVLINNLMQGFKGIRMDVYHFLEAVVFRDKVLVLTVVQTLLVHRVVPTVQFVQVKVNVLPRYVVVPELLQDLLESGSRPLFSDFQDYLKAHVLQDVPSLENLFVALVRYPMVLKDFGHANDIIQRSFEVIQKSILQHLDSDFHNLVPLDNAHKSLLRKLQDFAILAAFVVNVQYVPNQELGFIDAGPRVQPLNHELVGLEFSVNVNFPVLDKEYAVNLLAHLLDHLTLLVPFLFERVDDVVLYPLAQFLDVLYLLK